MVSQHALRQTSPVNRITDMSKNFVVAGNNKRKGSLGKWLESYMTDSHKECILIINFQLVNIPSLSI